jgi:competence protein ComEC
MSAEDRLLFIGCFFTLGIVLQGVYSSRVVFVASCFVATCSFTLARLLVQERAGLKTYVARAQMACSAMLLGLLVMNAHVLRMQNSSELALPVSGKTREVQGIVTDMPEVDDEGKWKAVLTCETAGCDPDLKGMRILLAGTCEPASELQIQTGDIVCASGRFYLPRAPLNPGEPDMRRIMGHRRQCGTLYVRDIADIRVLGKSNPNLIQRAAMSFRETVARTSETTLIPRHARMLTGMLLGKAPSHMKLALESTGTSHLFAASGLHVGYVALAVMTLLMPLRLPAPARFAAASVFIWIYAVACGLRASIVRAALMFSFTAVPKVMGRKMSPKSALVLASVAMFAICPFAVFDIGAQLSFLTVLAIAHLYPIFQRLFKPLGYRLSVAFALSVSAQVGAAPLTAWYFGMFAPIGIIANVPCIPLAGVAVLIGLSATLVGLVFPYAASALNAANSLVLLGLEKTINFFARIPFGAFTVKRPPLWFMVGYYLGIIAIGAPRRLKRRILVRRNSIFILILALSLGSVMYQALRPEVEIVFLSVGQGDAIFIRSAGGKSFLIDGGGLPGGTGDPGRDTILPFLRRKGINYIDVMVCTHPHYDHIKGLFAVIDTCRVGMLLKPEIPEHTVPDLDYALADLAKERNVPVVALVQGGWIDVGDGIMIAVLNPRADSSCGSSISHTASELNDLSLVMKMKFMDFTLLLTGDAGEAQLSGLLDMGEVLEASVLKVPHHGARDALDKAAQKGVIHRNQASRRKSRLAHKLTEMTGKTESREEGLA